MREIITVLFMLGLNVASASIYVCNNADVSLEIIEGDRLLKLRGVGLDNEISNIEVSKSFAINIIGNSKEKASTYNLKIEDKNESKGIGELKISSANGIKTISKLDCNIENSKMAEEK